MARATATLAALLMGITLIPPAWSSHGDPNRVYTYVVQERGDVQTDRERFAALAAETFDDPRGWSLGGSIRYERVASDDDADFRLWIASPEEVEDWAPACSSEYSCRVGDDVIINDDNWQNGPNGWPGTLHEYRHYLINHEVGHWLGFDDIDCPGAGEPGPVMMQQSISMDGCLSRIWPLPEEREEASGMHGVRVRFDDGFADLLWYETWNDHSVTVATSTGSEFEGAGRWLSGWSRPNWMDAADVNGDGRADLAWYEVWKDRSVTVATSTGSRFEAAGSWISELPEPDWIELGDVDNDGLADLVWYADGRVRVARSTGSSFSSPETWVSGWGPPDAAALEDVDRNGRADLVWYEEWKHGSVTVALSTGDRFENDGAWISGWGEPSQMEVADVRGDGRADLVWYENWKRDGSVTVAVSTGERFDHDGEWVAGWGNPDLLFIDDVDADGRADLLWYETWKDHSVTVALSDGDHFAAAGAWLSGWAEATEAAAASAD